MSRGPGKIERAITALFQGNPSEAFTVEEVAGHVYPGLNRVEPKHRVAIRRAAYNVLPLCGWWAWKSESPGSRLVYIDPLDFRSYAMGRLRSDFSWHSCTREEIAEMVDNSNAYFTHWRYWQPGGGWHFHVLINRARAAGDEAEVARLRSALEASVLGVSAT